jgi:hypothetical protein
MEAAFKASTTALCNAAQLTHLLPGVALLLAVDASSTHMGMVLQQHVWAGDLWLLQFFSVKLDQVQQKYSAFYREFQLVIWQ